jgi:hypothetical protein
VTSPRDDIMIRRISMQHPTWSSREISAEIPSTISARSIRQRLHDEFHLKACTPAKKPSLSKKNVRDRLAFCKQYRHWTSEMWRRVLFY